MFLTFLHLGSEKDWHCLLIFLTIYFSVMMMSLKKEVIIFRKE